jgi:hypothetical protein
VQEAREYFNPVARAASFARLYLPANRMLSHDTLLSLISQHLRILGLSETQASLHSEWGSEFKIPPHKLFSQLGILVQRAVHRTERFWELALPSVHACDTVKATQTALDEEISRTIGAAPTLVEDTTPLDKEVPNDTAFIRFEEGNAEPVEASLNQLIFCLTIHDPTRNTFLSELTNALCLTISSYCSSKIFLQKLRDRFAMIKRAAASDARARDARARDARAVDAPDADPEKVEGLLFIKLFKEWIRGAINDLEAQVLEEAQQFVNKELMPKYSRLCVKMFDKMGDQNANRLQNLESRAPPVLLGDCAEKLWAGEFSLLDLPIIELARQFTVWSSARYYAIRRCELLDCAWEKPRLRYRAPNVIALTKHYNRLSQWVVWEILTEKPLRMRLKKMEQLIELARMLFELRNYYDGMAVLSGFDSNAMFRLNQHIERLQPASRETLISLRDLCVPTGFFKELRKKYEEALHASKPILPYIGVLLSDLFKTYDATPTFVNGLINVRKCRGVYKMIANIEEFCRDKYYFLPIDQVQAKIDALVDMEEDTLLAKSLEIEKEDGSIPDDK